MNGAEPGERGAKHEVRLDVQGLRALAVLLVVLSHAGLKTFSGGYVGVDVFFVISGFLITSLLLREMSTAGRIAIAKFYARRAVRLLPASTLVAVVTLGGAWLFLSKIRFAEYAGDALSSSLYAVNFRFAVNGTDYLSQGSPPSPFQHFWSLAVEEQFYLVWPLLLLLSRKMAKRRVLMAVPLVALCLVSFGLSVFTTADSASWAYFGSHTRVWELGAGALLAMGAARLRRLPPGVAAPMTWAGLGCVACAALTFDDDTVFPGYHALLPVLGAVLVLAGGCSPARRDARWLLALPPARWLGGVSYSWYLWHWPLLAFGPMALGRPASLPLSLALCAVALLLAWATLHLVENPVRFHRAFRGRPGRAMGLGLGLSAGASALALTAALFPPPIAHGTPAPVLADALSAAPDPGKRLTEFLDHPGTRLPGNLATPLPDIKGTESAVYRDGCHVGYASTATPRCVYGARASDRTVVLFGDSHAAQWFPALDSLAGSRGWKLVSLTKASCKVAAVTTISHGRPYTACDLWRKKAIARISELRPALVLVSSSDAGTPVNGTGHPLGRWTAGYRQTFRDLKSSGASVAAILDTPWPKVDAVECAAAYPTRLSRCGRNASSAIQDSSRRKATRAAARSARVPVIDPLPWLCGSSGNCPVLVGNTVVYRDDSHLAESYSAALAPVLGRRLAVLGVFSPTPARP